MAGIGLLLLLIWGGLALYHYVVSDDKNEPNEAEQKWKEHMEYILA